jgi:murein DD-endopeptidase MepM/ murein hydrolase activator NlpD
MNGDRRVFIRLVLPALALLAGFAAVEFFRVGPSPSIRISPTLPAIGKHNIVRIGLSEPKRGLSFVRVELVQGDRTEALAERSHALTSTLAFWSVGTGQDEISVDVGRDTIKGLKAGNAVVRVTANRVPTWLRRPLPAVESLVLPVRLSPPAVSVLSTKSYVTQGGAEAVVYRVGDSAVRDGVRSGEWWFPGYPLPGGGRQDRFAFWAVPYDQNSPNVRLVAYDDADNSAEAAIVDRFTPKTPRSGEIQLSDAFMNKVVPEIISQDPDWSDRGGLLENYLAINGDLRRKQAEEIKALALRSGAELMWHQPFAVMPNSKVMSSFAERRTYRLQGRVVDQQDHLGYDLAATARAPVPAANSGVVLMARYFGIYGNTVVIDHGCGLMSLYGHLSSLAVTEGQKVERGDAIGQSGETGLAGGDHLHFTILLQGLPVDPVEWWDGHWIQDRIARKIGSGWPFQP